MMIQGDIMEAIKCSFKEPFLIYDKVNGSPFFKIIEDIIFSEDEEKYPFLGNILTDSTNQKDKELAYFFRNNPSDLRNFEKEIYTLRSWILATFKLNLENFFKNEEVLKIWKFESPDFIIETNFRTIGVEAVSAFTEDMLNDLDQKTINPSKAFSDYMNIKNGKNVARHYTYKNITKKEIENIENHITKVSQYHTNLSKFAFLNQKIEIYIIINFGGGSRLDIAEKDGLTNIISIIEKQKNFDLSNIFILICVTDKELKNKSKRNWICLKHYKNFNNWVIN